MHVIFVSECEKRALRKTRSVLDRFALRIGRRTWATPATEEGLDEIRRALKRIATRQTSVACFRNDGYRRLKMFWVVGSRTPFGVNGHVACATTRVFRASVFPEWTKPLRSVAYISGCSHDFGKVGLNFSTKLQAAVESRGGKIEDPVRHEWVSMQLMQMADRGSFDNTETPQAFGRNKGMCEKPSICARGLSSLYDIVVFCVCTHHRLFRGNGGVPGIGSHVKDHKNGAKMKKAGELATMIPERQWQAYKDGIKKILADQSKDPRQWRGTAILCRAILILADHQISALQYKGDASGPPYANTHKINGKSECNQPLWWHLERVARLSAFLLPRIATMKLHGLSDESVSRILHPSLRGMFDWQNRSATALKKLREKTSGPTLVLNIAETGTGKTRMNAKCASILAPAGRVRFAVVLNQRNLTLQTGDALRDQLGLSSFELATVIGDKTVRNLHEKSKADDAENQVEGEQYDVRFEADTSISGRVCPGEDLPEWLLPRAENNPSFARIVATPVLVATVDYLVSAGDLRAQGHHVDALLRLLDSDIVIDEVDGYDPAALPSILRLVQMVGFCGRSVICSSATLPPPTAEAIHRAFNSGVEMRAGMIQESITPNTVIIDNKTAPSTFDGKTDFTDFYASHVGRMLKVKSKVFRRSFVQPMSEQTVDGWFRAVKEASLCLHEINAWDYQNNKSISFGLVRVANVKTAIRVARYLAKHIPEARVACYHSADFLIQRHTKERVLDRLLTRKKGNTAILSDTQTQQIVKNSEAPTIPFIVVATPVEEVGRDHDFDWAVIEPSSTQSIVQTAGRVNRHRCEVLKDGQYNVAILDINFRKAKGEKRCFCWPGLESESLEYRYSSHAMTDLLDTKALQEGLDLSLRFSGKHKMAQEDNDLLSRQIKGRVEQICRIDNEDTEWMTAEAYTDLRGKTPKQSWRLNLDDNALEKFERLEKIIGYQKKYVQAPETTMSISEDRMDNAWLCFEPLELVELCKKYDIKPEEGLSFEILGDDAAEFEYDKDFGFYRK